MMIDESIGIQMCRNKKIRKQYGTIIYQEQKIILADPKKQYDEIHALIKKENKKSSKKQESKKVDIKKMTKEQQIQNLIDISLDDPDISESNESVEIPSFSEETIELIDNINDNDDNQSMIVEPTDNQISELSEQETQSSEQETQSLEQSDTIIVKQDGGLLTKKIYVTDLSVDKDKEMFQM